MTPTVFVSYSHDGEDHSNWVLQLATRLRSNGVDVILDKWNLVSCPIKALIYYVHLLSNGSPVIGEFCHGTTSNGNSIER